MGCRRCGTADSARGLVGSEFIFKGEESDEMLPGGEPECKGASTNGVGVGSLVSGGAGSLLVGAKGDWCGRYKCRGWESGKWWVG